MFLGIDCGTQGTKALVLNAENGKVLGEGSAPHSLISVVLLDDQGQVLRPAKLWCDTESAPENQRLLEYLGGAQGSLQRLGLVIAPGYTVSKLLWTKEQHPQVFERIDKVLLPHDYLNYWLTGRACTEYGDASGTG